jgi:hypothetical protein
VKVSKERRILCQEVTNSVEIENIKRREANAKAKVEYWLDMIFGYGLLFAMVIAMISAFIDWSNG